MFVNICIFCHVLHCNFVFFVFYFSFSLKITYIIKCCNCYFDKYLLEIDGRPETMNSERSNFLNIIRMKDMKTEWKSKDDIQKQWFLTDCEIVFHSCFDCAYKALQISGCRKKLKVLFGRN